MTNVKSFNVNGQALSIADGEARTKADTALASVADLLAQATGTYEGKSLAAKFANEILGFDNEWHWLQDRVQRGDFEGLMIKDYLDLTLTNGNRMRYRIGAIDPYYRTGVPQVDHHAVMVPDSVPVVSGSYATTGGFIYWSNTGSNQGVASQWCPYLASTLHKWEIDVFYPMLPSIVRERIKTRLAFLQHRYSAAGSVEDDTGWEWVDIGEVWSPSEAEVYGTPVWGTRTHGISADCQFPIFTLARDRIKSGTTEGRASWWLRTVQGGSTMNACGVTNNGVATSNYVGMDSRGPLPCFMIG